MINVVQPSALTTQATSIARVKYFPIEVYCANMIPNTTYDAYVNGQLVNAFCKPYAGKLINTLTSNAQGKLRFQYMMSVAYNQNFLVPPVVNSNIINATQSINLVDPFGRSSTYKLPVMLRTA